MVSCSGERRGASFPLLLLLLPLAFLLLFVVSSSSSSSPTSVPELTPENFDETLRNALSSSSSSSSSSSPLRRARGVFVHFHAEWSQMSKNAIEVMTQMRSRQTSQDKKEGVVDFEVVTVDCLEHRFFCEEHGMHSFTPFEIYPAFKFFWYPSSSSSSSWREERYEGPLQASRMIDWLHYKLSVPRLLKFESWEQFDKNVKKQVETQEKDKAKKDRKEGEEKKEDVTYFVSFLEKGVQEEEKLKRLEQVAQEIDLEDWRFAVIQLPKGDSSLPINTARLYRENRLLPGNLDISNLESISTKQALHFICSYGFTASPTLSIRTHMRFQKCSMLPFGLLFLSKNPWVEDQENERRILSQVAEEFRGKFQFAHQTSPHVWQDFVTAVGGSGFVFPTTVLFFQEGENVWKDRKMVWDEAEDLTKETLTNWLSGIQAGTTKTWRRSLPLPRTNNGPVKIVVGFNFEDVVLAENTDVLLGYHLNRHQSVVSKNLEIVLRKVGLILKNVPGITIAKTHGLHNGFPEFLEPVEEFPTVQFFPANSKKPITYDGPKSVRDIIEFIQKNSKVEFSVDLNLLSSTTIEDMEDEDVKLSYLGEDINKYQKVYTEEDYKNVNRQPKKEVRIPKNHPLYHYSTQHSHAHGPGGHSHSHDGETQYPHEPSDLATVGEEDLPVATTPTSSSSSSSSCSHGSHEHSHHGHDHHQSHDHHGHDHPHPVGERIQDLAGNVEV